MKKCNENLSSIKLVGITARANNDSIFKQDVTVNKVAETVYKYFHNAIAEKISNREKPGVTYCVYTDYESDYKGEYTYFIGEQVSSFEGIDNELSSLTIPAQSYIKFTNHAGPMPDVCVDLWKNIWEMSDRQLGGGRAYIADFEVYDERAYDHQNVELDIYIGIKQK